MNKPGRNDPCHCGSGKKYKKCCQDNPSSHSPAQALGQGTGAIKYSVKGVTPTPAECNHLVALFNAGHYPELESRARSLVGRYPDSGFVWKILGAALQIQGKDSLPALRKAAELLPGDAVAHYNLGNILHERGRLNEAEASYRRALQIEPDGADMHTNLGKTLQDIGRIEEAGASYRRALQIKPDHAEAHNNLGETLMESGRLDEAEASLRRALQIRPDYLKVRLSLASVRKVKADDENLAALIAVDEAARNSATPLSGEDAVCLHFALGKSYDDIGDHAKAFPYFLEGNRLKRATFDYDPDETARRIDSIMRNFDMATMDRLRGGGAPSHLPIFILGMPRSGTTLVEQIISSYPGVHGAGELVDLAAILRHDIAGAVFPDNLHSLDQARLTAWGAEYVAGLQRRAPDARRITDKMPANFLAVGLIHLMLPNAKIIHVNRNPVDTCLSCFTQLFKDGQEFTYDLAELGRYYVDYARLMEHWRKVLPDGAFLDVRYEDIVADQEAQSRRLIEYCGLEWDDACLDFHQSKRAVRTASMAQVRQPIYKSSVERWRPYEKFLGPLFDALGDLAPDR